MVALLLVVGRLAWFEQMRSIMCFKNDVLGFHFHVKFEIFTRRNLTQPQSDHGNTHSYCDRDTLEFVVGRLVSHQNPSVLGKTTDNEI